MTVYWMPRRYPNWNGCIDGLGVRILLIEVDRRVISELHFRRVDIPAWFKWQNAQRFAGRCSGLSGSP